MTYSPVLAANGFSSLDALTRSRQTSPTTFLKAAQIKRDTAYFEANIIKVNTPEELVNDRVLLRVALGAYGLEADIDKRFFVKSSLEDYSSLDSVLLDRLVDKDYFDFVKAFGFSETAYPKTLSIGFGKKITDLYKTRQTVSEPTQTAPQTAVSTTVFEPVIPFTGYAGWQYLSRTKENQQKAFNNTGQMQRETAYFTANIGNISTAEELVNDRQLLKVALGAYGLDADVKNKAFIRKVLEQGTTAETALANKLADKSYFALSEAFGFGDTDGPNTTSATFAAATTDLYKTRQFEIAVGQKDPNMRLALGIQRDLPDLAESSSTDTTKWYTILGSKPMRKVFEGAFGLPASFASLDLDMQVKTLRARVKANFGESTVAQFSDIEKVEKLVRLFLVRSDATGGSSTSSNSLALQLLQTPRRT